MHACIHGNDKRETLLGCIGIGSGGHMNNEYEGKTNLRKVELQNANTAITNKTNNITYHRCEKLKIINSLIMTFHFLEICSSTVI